LSVGTFAAIAGVSQKAIARLNSDGSFDSTFNVGTGPSNTDPFAAAANSLALQPDGKVIFGGAFISYNGTARSSIARANSDGSLDSGLNPTTSLVGNIWAMAKYARRQGRLRRTVSPPLTVRTLQLCTAKRGWIDRHIF
jgi:hypothetical protein